MCALPASGSCLNCCFFALSGIGFFPASFVITKGNGSTCGFFCPYSWAMLITSKLNLSDPDTLHVSSLHLELHVMSCSLFFFSLFTNELYFLDLVWAASFKTIWRKWIVYANLSVLNHSAGSQMCEPPAGPAGLCGWSCFYLLQAWGDPGNKAWLMQMSVEVSASSTGLWQAFSYTWVQGEKGMYSLQPWQVFCNICGKWLQ